MIDEIGGSQPAEPRIRHGRVRGADFDRRSSQFEGRFGRMFRTLPPATFDETMLYGLARRMTAKPDKPTSEDKQDPEENSGISAGYTYLGQFIDHDLSFDPASSLTQQDDPEALTDYRTPRFDLDSLYGRGPDDQPYLYRRDGRRMVLGEPLTGNTDDPRARGLPRAVPERGEPARALIGDPRNDENIIVSQLHAAFLRFHNRVVDLLGPEATFETVQRTVRWHYQWLVLHDFLPTIVGEKMAKAVLAGPLEFYLPRKRSFMPIEFSVAAYRFGHSMVRPIYRLNAEAPRLHLFAPKGPSLVGFRAFPSHLAIDWRLYFEFGRSPKTGPRRVQLAYKPDTSITNPLGALPPGIAASGPHNLATRNLLRGWRMQLPSGQAVARAMGLDPLPDKKLRIGSATEEDARTNPRLIEISPAFADNAPLWTYVLAEAQQGFVNDRTPLRLGPVGGRLVAEVIVGLMRHDSHSYLRHHPAFRPLDNLCAKRGTFGITDLLRQAREA